ncbi:8-amino-7-oxononanoate synthase [Nonlabens tegetincola]|uniref:aminotransferase class I/II-fold pyridoxal phosphate-dependent enzyme n=1 Tax=Nonlabens tegetincola TaxID=323273 RepID=UPI000A203E9A|nr:pyridoxal phosphate-dependent aminotransferase family protein [Nonlabens tegetincola]ARN72271.1 8-amino-7-oxononanoate synthase [Nonlabens tegetincola]
MLPDKLYRKIGLRHFSGSLRKLSEVNEKIDFASNDYLGFSNSLKIEHKHFPSGSTGSRLITGHSQFHTQVEQQIAAFHDVEAALLFNSGYDANLGVISSLTDRMDLILYDEKVHASIRDGIQLSKAKALKFKHNDLDHLKILLEKFHDGLDREVYILTESVFSMDGNSPDLARLIEITASFKNAHLILDEAHSLGVHGNQGEGLAQSLNLHKAIFARIITYGKAMGAHGAAVLGSEDLKEYLINYSRPFIYTTAIPPHAIAYIQSAYKKLQDQPEIVKQLQENIAFFNKCIVRMGLRLRFRESVTPIQICIIPDNHKVKQLSSVLQAKGFDVRAILSPTVPKGEERLRICLHSFNTKYEMQDLLQLLAKNI